MRIIAPAFEVDDIPGLGLSDVKHLSEFDSTDSSLMQFTHFSYLFPSEFSLNMSWPVPICAVSDSIELILRVAGPVEIIKSINGASLRSMASEGVGRGRWTHEGEEHESPKLICNGLPVEVEENLFSTASANADPQSMQLVWLDSADVAAGSGAPYGSIGSYEVSWESWDWVQIVSHEWSLPQPTWEVN